uniref:Large ribosomal subunit protein bL9m N-terminal domain-containing protein n=1 Tax=Cyprinus carpio TaxID=7962 RepID=A0A8C2ATA7_CYPCA
MEFIVECCWKVPLSKEGKPPRLHPRRHRVYRLFEDTKHKPQDKIELILTQTPATRMRCFYVYLALI